MEDRIDKSEEEWRRVLSDEQFAVCRRRGTEAPFSGAYWHHDQEGVYRCVCCGATLFESASKFDSGTGWPSFTEPLCAEGVATRTDHGHGLVRTEVVCARCGAHLGHVFSDGPAPTGQRYCINSVALTFEPRSLKESGGKS